MRMELDVVIEDRCIW